MLKIDNEFKSLIPPLSPEEYQQLEQNIINDGCREPLAVWDDTIVDGHNRYSICQKHNITFDTVAMVFDTRDDAMVWMIDNQSGRRNLADFVKFELKDKKAEILKVKGKEKQIQTLKQNANTVPSTIDKTDEPHDTRKIIADELKWSTGKVAQATVVKNKAPEQIKEQLRKSEITINQAYQQVKRIEKIEAIKDIVVSKESESQSIDINNPPKKYNIIYADPAWSYYEGGNKAQSVHYNTMSIEDICSLPIKNLADDNCILFLWITFPILQESFKVMESWGFKYSTCGFNWIKKNKISDSNFFGCGNWTRANSELCLIATKGTITRLDNTISQVVETPIEEHSKKPEIVRSLITRLVGELPRIELFSRKRIDGWDVWGNEI